MSEPISGGASKVAAEMLKEVQQAMNQADIAQTQAPGTDFARVMETQNASQVQGLREATSPTDVLRAATLRQRAPEVPALGRSVDTPSFRSGMQRILEDVMAGQNKYGKIMELAMSGREFSQAELLALQAGVYRFSQELELTSKVIEKGTSAIKQTLNTQV